MVFSLDEVLGSETAAKLAGPVATAPKPSTRPASVADALAQRGIAFTVRKEPVATRFGFVPTHCAIVRDDTDETIAVVGADYGIVQYSEAFSGMDALFSLGEAELIRAGVTDGAASAWMRARFTRAKAEVVKGDVIEQEVFMRTGHGTVKWSARSTVRRLVCENGMVSSEHMHVFNHRHSSRVASKFQQARDIVAVMAGEFERFVSLQRDLQRRSMQTADIVKYLHAVVPNPTDPEAARAQKNAQRIRDEIMELIESGRGAGIPGVRGTLYGAYQAAVEWVDHTRNAEDYDADERDVVNTVGTGAAVKETALAVAQRMLVS